MMNLCIISKQKHFFFASLPIGSMGAVPAVSPEVFQEISNDGLHIDRPMHQGRGANR